DGAVADHGDRRSERLRPASGAASSPRLAGRRRLRRLGPDVDHGRGRRHRDDRRTRTHRARPGPLVRGRLPLLLRPARGPTRHPRGISRSDQRAAAQRPRRSRCRPGLHLAEPARLPRHRPAGGLDRQYPWSPRPMVVRRRCRRRQHWLVHHSGIRRPRAYPCLQAPQCLAGFGRRHRYGDAHLGGFAADRRI
ncbi:MAG: Arginine exporter protein ArgO, partial [uncultured Propionibacteriaceae bacterium]